MRPMRSFHLPGIDVLCDAAEYTTAKQAQSVARQLGRAGGGRAMTQTEEEIRGDHRSAIVPFRIGLDLPDGLHRPVRQPPHLADLEFERQAPLTTQDRECVLHAGAPQQCRRTRDVRGRDARPGGGFEMHAVHIGCSDANSRCGRL